MLQLKQKKAKSIFGSGTADQTYITCKTTATTLPSLLAALLQLRAAQHIAACAVGDFRRERRMPFPYNPRRKPHCEVSSTNSCDMSL